MRVVLTDGTELSCTNFKAIESGVLLTKDKKRSEVFGFVSGDELKYVVPDDAEVEDARFDADRDFGARSNEGRDESVPADERDLRRLGGLGSTYADRLRVAGYRTLSDLAAADPVAVAESASVPPGRGREWVDAAISLGAETRSEGERDGDVETGEGRADRDRDPSEATGGDEAQSAEERGPEESAESGTESDADDGVDDEENDGVDDEENDGVDDEEK